MWGVTQSSTIKENYLYHVNQEAQQMTFNQGGEGLAIRVIQWAIIHWPQYDRTHSILVKPTNRIVFYTLWSVVSCSLHQPMWGFHFYSLHTHKNLLRKLYITKVRTFVLEHINMPNDGNGRDFILPWGHYQKYAYRHLHLQYWHCQKYTCNSSKFSSHCYWCTLASALPVHCPAIPHEEMFGKAMQQRTMAVHRILWLTFLCLLSSAFSL